MRLSLRIILCLAALSILLPGAASAEFLGLDVNANLQCDSVDMVQTAASGDVGTTRSVDVFFTDLPNPIITAACVFCVAEKSRVSNPSFTFSTPTAGTPWSNQFFTTAGSFPVTLSDSIATNYPNYLCFLLQSADFIGTNPFTTFPAKLGTLQYQVAEEGCIQWLFDSPNAATLTNVGFSSILYDSLGETCPPRSCPSAGPPLAINAVTPACPIPDATIDVPYPAGTIFTATGGTLPYTWGQSGLPEGMNVSSGGEVVGTPTQAGDFPFVVTLDDGAAGHVERNCSIFVIEYGVNVVRTSPDTVYTAQVDTVVHSFTVTNTGNTSGNFLLTASSDHGYIVEIFGSPNPVSLTGGNSATVQVRHIIPVVACPAHGPYAWDKAHLSAARQGMAAVNDADSAVAGIAIEWGTNLDYADDGRCITPGQTATDYFILENTGDCPDTFDLSASINLPTWSASILGNHWIFLAPGNPESIAVSVSVPSGALCTEVAQVRMDAIARNFGGANYTFGPECAATVLKGTLSDESNQVGAPGDTVDYGFVITNTGNCQATFDVIPQTGWAFIQGGIVTVAPGDVAPHTVSVVIPNGATDGQKDTLCAVLLAFPAGQPTAPPLYVDTSCVTTTVGIPCESTVEVVHTGDHPFCADPGSTNEDWFQVENTGNCADSFDLTPLVGPAGWTALLDGPATIFLNPDDLVLVRVYLSVPAGALCTDEGALSLRAEGRTYGAIGQGASGMWCVNAIHGGTLSDEGNQTGAPGDTVQYEFTVRNTGNCTTLFGVAFGSSWANVHGTAEEWLDPGDTAIVGVGHVVPKDVVEGDNDELCAVLSVLPEQALQPSELDTSCVVTTAIVPCDAAVDVNGPGGIHGIAPGVTTFFDFWVKNTGNVTTPYILSVGNDALWLVDIEGPDTTAAVAPDDSVLARVDVTAPEDATCEDVGRTDLTAFALCNTAIWDSAVVTASVIPVCSVTVEARTEDTTGAPGQGMDYFFRVTNEGNCEADFALSVSQSADWDTSFGPTLVTIPLGGHHDFPFHLDIPPTAQPGDEHKVFVCAECKILNKGDRPPAPLGVCDSTITRIPTGCVADQPVLGLGGYQTVSYGGPTGLWTVRVQLKNNGPGKAVDVAAEMHNDIAWLLIPDATCGYPDLAPGATSYGSLGDQFTFDLQNYPGGSFNVWFDVTYADTCGTTYQVRLDPTFDKPGENGLPASARLVLHQNVPNPFNPETSISFELQNGAFAELVIYNTAGQNVKTLWSGSLPAGLHTFLWNGESERGTSVPSGTYFYSVRSEGLSDTKRMVLVR